MVSSYQIPRTAAFAWSPLVSSPYLATGTKPGAVDEGFSNETKLELWNTEPQSSVGSIEPQPVACIATDSRFNDIAWTREGSSDSQGILAGALDNGSLDLWDAEKLLNKQADAFLSRTSRHSGSIKALQFNPFRSELLATVGAKGELFISDINNVGSPFRMGNAVARADDFECLDWNKRTSHIMVTGSSGGTMTVWDIKNKRESLTLNNWGRKAVSAVAWDPVNTTRLVTAIPDEPDPAIFVWDLRNANAPERVLKGHDRGILSLSWCQQDNDLLLSCGKDNRNICWNPQTGEALGEFPVVTNWTFQTRWNPHNPGFVATASFDGKISVQSIQSTGSDAHVQAEDQVQTADDEDFFNKASSQPRGSLFSLKKAPKWLQRPCGASFGFGGKIVLFKCSTPETNRRSVVKISRYAADDAIVKSTNLFESSLREKDLTAICDSRISEATNDADREDWKVIKTLIAGDTKKDLLMYLGYSSHDNEAADGLSQLSINGSKGDLEEETSNNDARAPKNNRLSAFFEGGGDGDNFLSELAATKGAKTNNPFEMYNGAESESDRLIIRALLLGEFDKALDVCLHEGRMSDAFMIAICGGQSCIKKAQTAYFSQKETGPNYLRLLASVVGKDLWDLVYNADLNSWKDVMASLCTYAEAGEFSDLCEALGDRLEEQMGESSNGPDLRKDAAFCYLAGSKLEKVVAIWTSELMKNESSSLKDMAKGSGFSIHARSLQSFIEKVTVFREAIQYQDTQQSATSDWKLAPLYDKYIEYADIASSHGQLQVAERYLDLLPASYSVADVAKRRVKTATQKPGTQVATKQPLSSGRAGQRGPSAVPAFQQEQQPIRSIPTSAAPANPYAPSSASANPYAPASALQTPSSYPPGSSQYGPPSYGNPSHQQQQAQPQSQLGMSYGPRYPGGSNGTPGPPPHNFNASPSALPPSKAANMGNWNDMPENFFKPPATSRRGTPAVGANSHPQFQPALPSPSHPIGPPPRSTPPLAPPPKAGTGPQRMTSPPLNQLERPSSAMNNPYAPSQSSLPVQSQATIPRGPSPYNAPPSIPPPNNRYAPSQPTSAAQSNPPTSVSSMRGPPPPPPSNPYAPQQNHAIPPQSLQSHQPPPPPSSAGPPPRSSVPSAGSPQGAVQVSKSKLAQAQRRTTPSRHRE